MVRFFAGGVIFFCIISFVLHPGISIANISVMISALPEIDIEGITSGSTEVSTANGTNFGSVVISSGEAVEHSFTITNSGDGTLQLTGTPTISINGA